MSDQWTPFKVWRAITWHKLKLRVYSLDNWRKGYMFSPIQRFRCCGHTTPFHDIHCRNQPPFMRDTIETKSIEIKGFQVNPDNLKYLTGGYLSGDLAQRFSGRGRRIDQTRDDLDPIPPEFPPGPPYNNDALNRWADLRRKAHPDAGE